jgi:hypothetical protein
MASVEIGGGRDLQDHLNVFGINSKNYDCNRCPFQRSKKFKCQRHNGDMTVLVLDGITRYTAEEFKTEALCCKD